MITVEGLTRKYGDFTAVDQVSFTIPKGQIVGLLGHNGAGKSTIMKMLTGYLEPTEGTVSIADLDIVENRLQIQQRLGYLPEVSPLYPEMTPVEYLEYVCRLRGVEEGEIEKRIKTAIDRTGINSMALKTIGTLSKGYKQRVGVAQAIINNPDILILDEPTSGLDPSQIHEMRSLIKELSAESTVMISTHILQEVEAMCDRVIIILNGKVAADSLLADLKGSNSMVLEVNRDQAAVEGALKQIEGVKKVEMTEGQDGRNSFVLELDKPSDQMAPLIADKAIAEGWQVFEIGRQRRNLEAVFREINEGVTDAQ